MSGSSKRGRPPIDTAWNALINRAASVIPHETEDNEDRVEEWRATSLAPRGCKLRPGRHNHDNADGATWLCQMYVGGKQRVIGSGTLHQCARLYDAAIWRFKKYRNANEAIYNFDEESARRDNSLEADVVSFLTDLEALLLERKLLTTAEERKGIQEIREVDQRHDRTASGRIEVTQRAIIDQVETLKIAVQDLTTLTKTNAMTLALIQSYLVHDKPAKEDRRVIPSIPEIFKGVTPVGVIPQTNTAKQPPPA